MTSKKQFSGSTSPNSPIASNGSHVELNTYEFKQMALRKKPASSIAARILTNRPNMPRGGVHTGIGTPKLLQAFDISLRGQAFTSRPVIVETEMGSNHATSRGETFF